MLPAIKLANETNRDRDRERGRGRNECKQWLAAVMHQLLFLSGAGGGRGGGGVAAGEKAVASDT